ncbi:hypothetical protein JL721_11941 [Aureococcus anophagefferens]|nr:hypothetical protein JL721_11941 [Aureococcus anophagefferens]
MADGKPLLEEPAGEDPRDFLSQDVGPEHVRPTGLNDAPLAAEVAPAYEAAGWEKSPKSDAVAPSDDWEDGAPLEKRPCCGACDDNPRCQACCAKGKQCCLNCLYDPTGLKSLSFGGFYWRRESVLLFVSCMFLGCVLGDFLLATSIPTILRQAKKSAKAEEYGQEYETIFGYKSHVECAINVVKRQVEEVATNCTDYQARRTRMAVEAFWNETEAWLHRIESGSLNCSRRTRDYDNMSWVEWVDYAEDLSDSVGEFADAIVALEDSMNEVTADMGISNYQQETACDGGDASGYLDGVDSTGTLCDDYEEADRYINFARKARSASDSVGDVSDCLQRLYGVDDDATFPPTTNTAKLFKGIVQLIDMVAHMLMDVNVDLVILVYVGLMLLHGLMLLFILYVVYCPGLGVNEFIYYLYDESYKRVMPKRYERRCRELVDAANAAFADTAGARASKNYNMAYKMARKSVAAESACDVHYVVRFWLIYLFIDVLLFVCGLLILFHFVIIAMGNKATCRAVFDLLPGIKASLRIFKETAEKSCFFELSDSAYGTHRWYASEIEEDCDVEIQSALIKAMRGDRGDAAIITIATILLCVGHWCLIHWLPAAMAYAKPESLRAHLEDLIVNNEDAEPAPLVSRAKSEMMLADVPPPGDDDAAPAADGDAPEEKAPDAADDEPTVDLPPPRLLVDLPPSPEAGVVDLPPPPPPAERDDVEATTLSPGATKHLIDQPGVGVDCCGVGSQDAMEDPPAQPQVKML